MTPSENEVSDGYLCCLLFNNCLLLIYIYFVYLVSDVV